MPVSATSFVCLAARTNSVVSDLLSAAGVLLAIATMLYSLWYQDMEDAAEIKVPHQREDRGKPQRVVRAVRRGKAIPLVSGTCALAAVLLPDAARICLEAAQELWRDGARAVVRYDAVRTAYVLTTVGAVFMATRAMIAARRIGRKLRDLNGASET